jgi:hypothetical protein
MKSVILEGRTPKPFLKLYALSLSQPKVTAQAHCGITPHVFILIRTWQVKGYFNARLYEAISAI